MNERMKAAEIAKGILSESPDYTPESAEDFTIDIMLLAESLMEWSESGEEYSLISYFAALETMRL